MEVTTKVIIINIVSTLYHDQRDISFLDSTDGSCTELPMRKFLICGRMHYIN